LDSTLEDIDDFFSSEDKSVLQELRYGSILAITPTYVDSCGLYGLIIDINSAKRLIKGEPSAIYPLHVFNKLRYSRNLTFETIDIEGFPKIPFLYYHTFSSQIYRRSSKKEEVTSSIVVRSKTKPKQEIRMTDLNVLTSILNGLKNESTGIEACALISEDGLLMASSILDDIDETSAAGMASVLLTLSSKVSTELRRGSMQHVLVYGDEGLVIVSNASQGTSLLVLADKNARLGLVFFDMKSTVDKITRALSTHAAVSV
jgi:predicted regulator of Ras-like GTPase activity (Roadblock/LC7/MglB family)